MPRGAGDTLGNGIEDGEVFGMIHHELAAKLERILTRRVRKLVHEAFQVDRILIVVHSAPEVRRDVRVAHSVVDEQVRNRIAERTFRTARIEALEHNRVLPVLQVLRNHIGEDRLARNPHVQRREIVVAIKRADHLRLRDGMVAAVRHVFFA